jgi:hypothetical protein
LKAFNRSNKIVSEIKVTKVNIKAVRHFMRSYKNILDAKWYTTEGGFTAIFLSKGISTKVVYDAKGRWFYNLLSYTEADPPSDIRHMAKSKYYAYDIFGFHQFEFKDNKTVYLISMIDKQSDMITLKICNGEMTNITELEKN